MITKRNYLNQEIRSNINEIGIYLVLLLNPETKFMNNWEPKIIDLSRICVKIMVRVLHWAILEENNSKLIMTL